MFVSQSDKEKNFSISVPPKIFCGGQSGMGVGRARGLSEATLGSSICVMGSRSWSVLHGAYKMLGELKFPECAIFKCDTLRSAVFKNLLKDFMNMRV